MDLTEVVLLHPEEVPAPNDGGGELFPRVGSARDPVLDVAVLALPAVAIVEGAAGVLLAAQDAARFAVDEVLLLAVLVGKFLFRSELRFALGSHFPYQNIASSYFCTYVNYA